MPLTDRVITLLEDDFLTIKRDLRVIKWLLALAAVGVLVLLVRQN
jgi:hypothetical protein